MTVVILNDTSVAMPKHAEPKDLPILAVRVREARDQLGWSQEDLAERVGMTQTGIASIESGDSRRPRKLMEIARALGKPQEWFLGEDSGAQAALPLPKPDVSFPIPVQRTGKLLPVYGQAAGGMADDGKFILNGQKLADVFAPPSLENVVGAYAVYHSGESMAPRYEPGELLTINPSVPVRPGDYVLVQIKGEPGDPPFGYVKRFISRNAKELVLEQLNPPEGEDRILRFPIGRVISVHAVWTSGRG